MDLRQTRSAVARCLIAGALGAWLALLFVPAQAGHAAKAIDVGAIAVSALIAPEPAGDADPCSDHSTNFTHACVSPANGACVLAPATLAAMPTASPLVRPSDAATGPNGPAHKQFRPPRLLLGT